MKFVLAENPTGYCASVLNQLFRNADKCVIHTPKYELSAEDFLVMIGQASLQLRRLDATLELKEKFRAIGIIHHDNPSAMAMMIGSWLAGLVPVLLDYRQSPSEIKNWIDQKGLSFVISSQKRFLGEKTCIYPAENLFDLPESKRQEALGAIRECNLPSDDSLAEVLTSSGVSGPPKFYGVSQSQLLKNIRQTMEDNVRGQWGIALSALSVSFGGARLIWLRNLLTGKPIFAMSLLFKISDLDSALRNDKVEECTLPPVLIRQLINHAQQNPGPEPRYPHLVKLQSIGGPATGEEKLKALEILSNKYTMTYSSTETGVVSRISCDEIRNYPESVGRPSSNLNVDIIGDSDQVLPHNTIGRIRVSWPQLGIDGKDKTYAFPGDLGWIDDNGYLYVSGRGTGVVSRSGINFWLGSVENRLLSLPYVADVAAIRLPETGIDDAYIIAVLLKGKTKEADFLSLLRQELPAHERPDDVIIINNSYINAAGKIRQSRVLQEYLNKKIQ